MKFAIVFVACLLGIFVAAEEEKHAFIDRHHIKPLDLHVEPIGPAPEYPATRIIGGTVAPPHAFPYQVACIINNVGLCGGAIISNEWILTAAHCIQDYVPEQIQIIAGAQNPFINESTQVILTAVSLISHPDFDGILNDIGLIRTTNIPIGSVGISSVDLAPTDSGTFAESQAVLSGWGKTDDSSTKSSSELRNITLPIITNQVCQKSFGGFIKDSSICTSGAGGVGACSGDSGGPLVVDGVDVGVVSFGSTPCADEHPSVYARVSFYRNWIRNNTGV